MNQQQFDTIFTALYFALSTHDKNSGITFRKGRSFFSEGYALIELDRDHHLQLELADLAAYRDAGALKKQRLLDGLIGQARLALSVAENQSCASLKDVVQDNES